MKPTHILAEDPETDSTLGISLTLVTSVAIDATGVHAPYGIFACAVQIIACIILLCWNSVDTGAKMAAFCKSRKDTMGWWNRGGRDKMLTDTDLAGTAYSIQPVVFTWANKILSRDGDDAARAITLYSMNGELSAKHNLLLVPSNTISGASSVLFSFWGIVLYPTTDAATVSIILPIISSAKD